MEVQYDGQDAFAAAANGDFPLVVLLWGVAAAARPRPVDLLVATDDHGNSVLHCAASSKLQEGVAIVHFLLQQAQATGRAVQDVVNARNHADETPLIRAAHVGNLEVVDALVQQGGANLRAVDKDGNLALHHAAAEGHLWVLHYLLTAEQRTQPPTSSSSNGASLSEDGGTVSKSMNSPLHYACAREHAVIVQYLLSRGFDPRQSNIDGKTPIDIARSRNNKSLRQMLESGDQSFSTPPAQFRQTDFRFTLLYAIVFFFVLSTSYWAPWWIALPLALIVFWRAFAGMGGGHGHGHGHNHGNHNHHNHNTKDSTQKMESLHPSKRNVRVPGDVSLPLIESDRSSTSGSTSLLSTILQPHPEIIMGVWVGWVCTFTMLLIIAWSASSYRFVRNEVGAFLYVLAALEVVFLVVWGRLTLLSPIDPGVVQTFQQDIGVMLANAANGVVPPEASHCRTCLVRKPVRSKHCAKCGVCVARMDHHCGWINRCVGYGNHRLFIIFLMLHVVLVACYLVIVGLMLAHFLAPKNLASSKGSKAMRVWMQIPTLIGSHLLVVLVLFWGAAALAALIVMLGQNVRNALSNFTTNERINYARYAYIESESSGKKPTLRTRFDRGAGSNLKEFWDHSTNYHEIYELPSIPTPPADGVSTVYTAEEDRQNEISHLV